MNGGNGVFRPIGKVVVGRTAIDDFSHVTVPTTGIIVLQATTPAQLSLFRLRVNEICSEDGTLLVKAFFFGDRIGESVSVIN